MIGQLNMYGMDRVETAIKRLQTFVPAEGYHLAFSGGKDSIVIKALAEMAGVKYDAHYNVTSVDPPELIWFIQDHHPDVEFDKPRYKDGKQITMWNLIPLKKMPPTRTVRYCCQYLKEGGGQGRFTVTGVRWAESAKRKNGRAGLEIGVGKMWVLDDPDNPANAQMAYSCPTRGKHILNPIIDWSDADVWEFIHRYKIPYCKLYDEGFKRLGCVGCPMATSRAAELERYQKYKTVYLKAFDRMLQAKREAGLETAEWETPEQVMAWWLGG